MNGIVQTIYGPYVWIQREGRWWLSQPGMDPATMINLALGQYDAGTMVLCVYCDNGTKLVGAAESVAYADYKDLAVRYLIACGMIDPLTVLAADFAETK